MSVHVVAVVIELKIKLYSLSIWKSELLIVGKKASVVNSWCVRFISWLYTLWTTCCWYVSNNQPCSNCKESIHDSTLLLHKLLLWATYMYKLNTQCVDKGICCVYKAILGKCVVWTTWIHTVLALKAWSAKQQFVIVIILLWSNSLRSGFNITILKNINTSNVTSLTNFYRKLVYSEHHIYKTP